ncbi:MAG: hypothetical protein KAW12_10135 [Candidatus Aminicenantes bacterium]|nr:hypothetical protein [Candidatus Aminicenantes bacterium]
MKVHDQMQITIRMQSPVISSYYRDKSVFRTKNYAAERAAEIYPYIREFTLNSLRGKFQKEEIQLLTKIFSLQREPGFMTSVEIFSGKIEETATLMNLKDDEKEMLQNILSKIRELDVYQVVVFSEWLVTFLAFSATYKGIKKISFNDYVKKLL